MLIVFIAVVPFCVISSVSASTVTSATISVAPNSGDIYTNIIAHVRGEPYFQIIGAGQDPTLPVCYLYYDSKLVVARVPALTVAYGFDCVFDINFTIPNQYPYSNLGNHTILAVIEASDGTTANASVTFDVTTYFPPANLFLQWWNSLNATEKADFAGIGPQGPQGVQGVQGPQGVQGIAGINGSMWYYGNGLPSSAIGVNKDYYLNTVNANVYEKQGGTWVLISNIRGLQGIQGVQGVQGIQGMQGVQGKQGVYPWDMALANILIAGVALIVSAIVLVGRVRKETKVD